MCPILFDNSSKVELLFDNGPQKNSLKITLPTHLKACLYFSKLFTIFFFIFVLK